MTLVMLAEESILLLCSAILPSIGHSTQTTQPRR